MSRLAMSRETLQSSDRIIRLDPSRDQLEMLQSLCQSGAPFHAIAQQLRVKVSLLHIWEQRHDEAGDALRVARDIHALRTALNL
jgi:hypothetical protein